jgi:glycosyltransferase involved in cell wall biosynthesis
MKLGIISVMEGYPWGGSEELWCELAEVALREKHEVKISVKDWNQPQTRLLSLAKKGADILHRKKSLAGRVGSRLSYYSGLRSPFLPFENFNADLLVMSEGSAFEYAQNLYWTTFALESKIPYCFIIQNVFESQSLNEVRRKRSLAVYAKAKKLFFVSRHNQDVVQRQLATFFPQAEIINNPVLLPSVVSSFAPPKEDDTVSFATVGRLDCHSKGQDILLECLSAAVWEERNWKLNIYGVGQDQKHLESLIKFYNLGHKVFMKGFHPVSEIWNENQLLIMPSYNEGVALALLEAMSHGIPAVVTNVGGQAEWVEEAVNGFIAAAPTIPEITVALERAWQAKDRWREMGVQARKKIQDKYQTTAGEQLFERIAQLVP